MKMVFAVLALAGLPGMALGQVGPATVASGVVPAANSAAASQRGPASQAVAGDLGVADLAVILAHLASPDFALRDAAQKELDAVPAARRGELQALAEKAADPEVRARLTARVEAMDEQAALHPAGLTLDLKNATLAEVSAALSAGTGVPFNRGMTNLPESPTFTLTAKERPLWEIYRQVAEPPLIYNAAPVGIRVLPVAGTSFVPTAAENVLLQTMSLSRPLPNAAVPVPPNELRWIVQTIGDPRLWCLGCRTDITSVLDDQGGIIPLLQTSTARGGSGPVGPADFARANLWQTAVTLGAPDKAAKTMTARGMARVQIVTGSTAVTIDDSGAQLNQPLKIGDATVTVEVFGRDGARPAGANALHVRLTLTGGAQQPEMPVRGNVPPAIAAAAANRSLARVQVLDADNTEVGTDNITGTFDRDVILYNTPYKAPFHLVVRIPLKIKTVDIPFEIKDLALPK